MIANLQLLAIINEPAAAGLALGDTIPNNKQIAVVMIEGPSV